MSKLKNCPAQIKLVISTKYKRIGLGTACILMFAQVAIIGAPYGSPVQPFGSPSVVSARLDESQGLPVPLGAVAFASRALPKAVPVRDSVAILSVGGSSNTKYPRLTVVRSPAAIIAGQKQARSYRAYPSAASVSALNQGYSIGTITADLLAEQLQNPTGAIAVTDFDPPTESSSSTVLSNASEDLAFGFKQDSGNKRNYSTVAIVRNFDNTARNLSEPNNGVIRPNINTEILRFNCKTSSDYGRCQYGPNDSSKRDPVATVRAIYPIDVNNDKLPDLLIAAESTKDANLDASTTTAGVRVFLCLNFGDRFGCKGTGWTPSTAVSPGLSGLSTLVTCLISTQTDATDCEERPRLGTSISAVVTGPGKYTFLAFAGQNVFATKASFDAPVAANSTTTYTYDGYVTAAQIAQLDSAPDLYNDMLVQLQPPGDPVPVPGSGSGSGSDDEMWHGPIPASQIQMIDRIQICRGQPNGECVQEPQIAISDGLVTATNGVGFRYGVSAPLIGVANLAAPSGTVLDSKPEIVIASALSGSGNDSIQSKYYLQETRLLTVGGNKIQGVNLPLSSTLVATSSGDTPEVLSGMFGDFVNAHSPLLIFKGFAPAPDIAVVLKNNGDVYFLNNTFTAPAQMGVVVRSQRLEPMADIEAIAASDSGAQ